MTSIFGPEATKAALDKLPENEGGLGVQATKDDVGVVGAVNKDLGKPGGWFVAGEGAWWRKAGYTAAAWLGWKGKP